MADRQRSRQATATAIRAAIDSGWNEPRRKIQLMQASVLVQKRVLADRILAALHDPEPLVSATARETAVALKLDTSSVKGPLIGTLKAEEVLNAVLRTKGDTGRGERVFTQAGCTACHTTRAEEPLKGPFLGNIATLYKRRELAEAILEPNKSVAQGFAANRFELKDGEEVEGFVIVEQADRVVVRNIAGQEIIIKAAEIARREKLAKSLMPDGLAAPLTVSDFASMLDYLESLSANGGGK